ncbi:hypothetical protein HK100_006391 [Physocladia obscura]|uniref:Major facilitator superfamily (MFS) profile domain-containing protein n=1 Tax=Physocladia obscura TaxID=109957 RepID=A0AAD5X8T7_9FUNG|nr:hypothetical protein HK100_006391 [Physocladia obscura]
MSTPSSFKTALPGILICCVAAFGGFLFGFDTGTISGNMAMQSWINQFGTAGSDGVITVASSINSLVGSIMAVGEFVGALLGSPVADSIGRRYGTISACLVLAVGVAIQAGAPVLGVFILGRIVGGVGIGLVSAMVPMYQSECAPKWIRGTVVTGYQWFITIGILIANIVNNATKDRADDSAFRIPIGIQIVWASVMALGMFCLPESPRYYVKKNNLEEARKSLARLNAADANSAELDSELADIVTQYEAEVALGEASYTDCFKKNDRKVYLRTMTGILIQAFQQLTGVNLFFTYGTVFFQNAGFTDPFTISMVTSGVNCAATLPSFYLIERFGRRNLLIYGAAAMFIFQFIAAVVSVAVGADNLTAQTILVVFVCLYIASFAMTWGPVAWVVLNEIHPLNIRAKSVSMGTASNWFWNFIIAFVNPYIFGAEYGNIGSKILFIYGTTCFFCTIYAYFYIYETKGLSLEQIDHLYANYTALESAKADFSKTDVEASKK